MENSNEKVEANTISFEDIFEGYEQSFKHLVTVNEVDSFAKLTGDYNPVHIDPEFAKLTNFGKRVVHGMLTSSFISTIIGMRIPGPGSLWLSQTINFVNPTYIGDLIEIKAVVTKISRSTRTITLAITISNQNGLKLVEGESIVRMLDIKKKKTTDMSSVQKTVLITGGSRGIGAATARKLADEGYFVIINYVNGKVDADNLVDEINKEGKRSIALQGDVSDWNDVDRIFTQIELENGPILYVVHCASPNPIPQLFEEISWDLFQKNLNVQVKGAFNCAKRALPNMLENKNGSFVNLGTIFTDGTPPVQQSPYVTSKAALNSFTHSMAVEYGPKGIRFNSVNPGMTQTQMISSIPDKVKMLTKMNTPLRSLAEPEDIANSIAFLLGPQASHITGETLRVCGGIFMG
jgi:3-oxoacyl-[acyl-carrier protein] reductase